jgi:hypothetical protein
LGFYVARLFLRDSEFLHNLRDNVSPAWVFATVIVGVTLPLFLHEAGHIVGGKLVGFRFALYVAGPIMITRVGERLKFQLHRQWSLYGGIAATVPVDDHDLLRRMSWMVAAGPITSLLVGAASMGAAVLVDSSHTGLRFFLLVLGVSGFMNFVAVTVPSTTGGFLTDRSRFLLLRRGGIAAERAAASALLGARNMAGERPRDWPASSLSLLESATDTSFDSLLGQSSHVVKYYEDIGQPERALATLDRVVEHIDTLPSLLHPTLRLERAYLTAVVRGDAAAAREDLERIGPNALVEPWDRLRAEAAILFAEGNAAGARELAVRALEQLADATQYGTTRLGRDQLEAFVSGVR